jgi:hypothetical protein
MDLTKSELEVLMNSQNYEQKKLEETKTKMADMSKSVKEKEMYSILNLSFLIK